MSNRKKLIEVALPLDAINDASAYDKMPGIGPHPKGIHQWWARLPLPCARALLFASLVDDPASNPAFSGQSEVVINRERERLFDIIRGMLQKKPHEHPEVFAVAQAEIVRSCSGNLPTVLDPFCGGGSIPLEAQRLGLSAHASDLNPVAVLVTKALLEVLPRFTGTTPVNRNARQMRLAGEWVMAHGLADDVRHYGRMIRERAQQRVGMLYPKVKLPKQHGGSEANVIAWLWTRTVRCPNPACGAQMPLINSFQLATNKGKAASIHPVVDNATRIVRFEIGPTKGHELGGTKQRGNSRCLVCGMNNISDQSLREQSKQYGIIEQALAVVAEGSRGRVYLNAETASSPTVNKPDAFWLDQPLPDNPRWFSPPAYGLSTYRDLFTPRQLLGLETLSALVLRYS